MWIKQVLSVYDYEKEYRVLVACRTDEEQLKTWRRGVVLVDGYRTAPAQVRMERTEGKGAWLRVTLNEGRKRQIRETGSQLGLPVVKIIRVRIGSLHLGSLKPREWRYLTAEEVAVFKGVPGGEISGLKNAAIKSGKIGRSPKKSGESNRLRRTTDKDR